MSNFYDIKAASAEQPEDSYRPSLPARFLINNCLKLDEKLWLYDVFDQIVNQPARLWLEEINLQPEAYQSRAISLQKLSHGNLLPVYNHFMWGENGKKYYVCVAKAPGKDYVNSRMLIASSPGINVVGQIARQLALALMYCHSQKVLHGNLQPSFIWVGRDGTVRLELFGALPNRRHALKNGNQDSFSNSLLNAPYASPELFGSNAIFNSQTDVYALGVIIYEMLSGFNPFLASSELVSGLRHMYKAVPPLHQVNPEVGPALESAVMTALYKNPEGRYHNVLELLSQFEIGLATTLQNAAQPLQFQTIEQLLENYTALNNEVQAFLKPAPPSLAETNKVREEKYRLKTGPELEKEEKADADAAKGANNISPAPPSLLQTSRTQPALTAATAILNGLEDKSALTAAGPDGPAKPISPVSPPVRISKSRGGKPAPVTKSQVIKWSNLVPWLLVLNLFFMGYLAWLLLNSVDTSGSDIPIDYPTNPPRAFFTPSLGETPTPVSNSLTNPAAPSFTPNPATVTVVSTRRRTITNTAPPPLSQTTPTPGSAPTITDPRVLTALAPTATPEFNSSEPVATVRLSTDTSPAPGETP